MTDIAPLIATHGGAAGLGALVLYAWRAWLGDSAHARVTAARRDEALLPLLAEQVAADARAAREDAQAARALAERSIERENQCQRELAALAARVAVLETQAD